MIDRFELFVEGVPGEVLVGMGVGNIEGDGKTYRYHNTPNGRVKLECWGEAAEPLFDRWANSPLRDQMVVSRIDIAADQSADYTDESALIVLWQEVYRERGKRISVDLRNSRRYEESGQLALDVGSYASDKSFTVYDKGDRWRVEVRLRGEHAREVAAMRALHGDPVDYEANVITQVQADLIGWVPFPVTANPKEVAFPKAARGSRRLTPSERLVKGQRALLQLADKHDLWPLALAVIQEAFREAEHQASMAIARTHSDAMSKAVRPMSDETFTDE